MKDLDFLYTMEQVILPDSFFRRVIFGKECAIWQCYDLAVCCVLKYVLGLLSHNVFSVVILIEHDIMCSSNN